MDKEYAQLLDTIEKNKLSINEELLRRAYEYGKKAHEGQKRLSGKPYYIHAVATTIRLIDLKMDEATVIAGLLHDVPEDTEYTVDDLRKEFGDEVATLVDGVTKLGTLKYRGMKRHAENLRKLFVAMAQDIRVIIIRLADRTHNLSTLKYLRPDKQLRIAKETLDIYAPIANRLGMGEMKGELEDLAFPYVFPKEHARIKRTIPKLYAQKEKYLNDIREQALADLRKEGVTPIEVKGRAKHLYSLYQKLQRYDNDLTRIHDLIAIRIIVHTVKECYEALGVIHSRWKPIVGRIKDYISQPKPNGYQSLHTTVWGPDGTPIEFQIRTEEMHHEAELGVAAHWHYDEHIKENGKARPPKEKMRWIAELLAWQEEAKNETEYLSSLKIDIFNDRIFVFTPKGDVIDLPLRATALDLAFHIHTDVGFMASGAKVNEKNAPLRTELKSGDVVEIITDKKRKGPSHEWLSIATTSLAHDCIQAWFKKNTKKHRVKIGTTILDDAMAKLNKPRIEKIDEARKEQAIKKTEFQHFDDALAALASGEITVQKIINQLFENEELMKPKVRIKRPRIRIPLRKKEDKDVRIEEQGGIITNIAQCCRPSTNDSIIAVSTRPGISIHKKNCLRLTASKSKRLKAQWASAEEKPYETSLKIVLQDRVGLASDITQIIAAHNLNILSMRIKPQVDERITFIINIELTSIDDLVRIIEDIKNVRGFVSIERVVEK